MILTLQTYPAAVFLIYVEKTVSLSRADRLLNIFLLCHLSLNASSGRGGGQGGVFSREGSHSLMRDLDP